MKVVAFKPEYIDIVFDIQRRAYKPLYEKYHDEHSNPYMESKEKVLQKYMRESTQGYVFIKDEKAVGTVRVNLYPESKSARIFALSVLPKYQDQGIAQEALLIIEKIHKDIKKWFLDTILEEPGNCHLYEKIGYYKTGKTEIMNEKMTLVFYEKRKTISCL